MATFQKERNFTEESKKCKKKRKPAVLKIPKIDGKARGNIQSLKLSDIINIHGLCTKATVIL